MTVSHRSTQPTVSNDATDSNFEAGTASRTSARR